MQGQSRATLPCMTINNLFADIPPTLPEEITQTLFEKSSLRIERIVSHGQASADGFWYDQQEDEWVLLVSGAARLEFKDRRHVVELHAGDFIHIPCHQQHRVAWTKPGQETIWLAIFFQ